MMRQPTAFKKAKKLWGNSACIVYKKIALKLEDRNTAMEENARLRKEKETATPERAKEINKILAENSWKSFTKPYNVGRIVMGMFFEVLGSGDTWEEAFEEAEKRG